jgi:transglutaminase-like putative cysteine protease
MRIQVKHKTVYRYTLPVKSVLQMLRVTPRNHDGQHVVDWRIDVSVDCRLQPAEDAFGNITHTFTALGPFEQLSIHVTGEVEMFDTAGVVRGSVERFPPDLYLRDGGLAASDEALRHYAMDMTAGHTNALDRSHALLGALHGDLKFDPDDCAAQGAAAAFAARKATVPDAAHVFIAASRHIGIPARYVSGYRFDADPAEQSKAYAWAESYIGGLGWVGFDPLQDRCPDERYIRIAFGLDQLGALPIRGARTGGDGEAVETEVRISQAGFQSQS